MLIHPRLFVRSGAKHPPAIASTPVPVPSSRMKADTCLQKPNQFQESIEGDADKAEGILFSYFQSTVKSEPPAAVLKQFQDFFLVHQSKDINEILSKVTYQFLVFNQPDRFCYSLNYVIFILISHWLRKGEIGAIRQLLLRLKADPDIPFSDSSTSFSQQKFSLWLRDFKCSQYFRNLFFFVPGTYQESTWGDRYYLFALGDQYLNEDYPYPQQEAARFLLFQLRQRYKFRLAMYLNALREDALPRAPQVNPTHLDRRTLLMIQQVFFKRKQRNYEEPAQYILEHLSDQTFGVFKQSLVSHLIICIRREKLTHWLHKKLQDHLQVFAQEQDGLMMNQGLLYQICDGLFGYFLNPEYLQNPAHPLTLLLVERDYLTLANLLLRLLFVCPETYRSLLASLNRLVFLYDRQPLDQCEWLVGFLETMNVILAMMVEEPAFYRPV